MFKPIDVYIGEYDVTSVLLTYKNLPKIVSAGYMK